MASEATLDRINDSVRMAESKKGAPDEVRVYVNNNGPVVYPLDRNKLDLAENFDAERYQFDKQYTGLLEGVTKGTFCGIEFSVLSPTGAPVNLRYDAYDGNSGPMLRSWPWYKDSHSVK